ncbi:hypothetical protein O6H91_03G088800 [Diphasiastrum complanatum]|uniref:Uncharacterized protein n=2 Tax=Diphasiastrum complanatum TaxID=34168 RepID=A0ACC2E8U6_DIPCM|nr:hypothetical protein O6H91_03G088800 [Diphasiastrum complanatum]KAJ7562915.1 hypothetical protein O6H91_03G088800 [Diphasiastrum complanatum]
MPGSRFAFALLTFVTIGMAVGALFQLAFLKRLEETSGVGMHIFRRKVYQSGLNDHMFLPKGLSLWDDDEDARALRIGFIKQEIINWSPRIIIFHNFLSHEECEYLIELARPRMGKATVVDVTTGKGVESKVRTSSGMFLTQSDRKYPITQAIEKRISVYSMVPVENGEHIQVLQYEKGQYYNPHHDYFSDEFNLKRGGQRVATMLMYLSDGVEGGETFFPAIGTAQCRCGGELKRGICINPRKGDALLFWSTKLDGSVEPDSLHGGCSVLSGEKWSATKWMRQNKFD